MEQNHLTEKESARRNYLKEKKPYVYEKIQKFEEKYKSGESIAMIQLQYNYACNFKCQHCSIERFQNHKKRSLTPADVKELARQADELGLARFVITGGEPLIIKEFDELVAAIDPQKFYINCDTNGWFLDKERAQHLKDIGVDRMSLSIDSLDPEGHDNFRRAKGSHARTLRAIDACQEVGLDIYVQTVVTKQRLHSEEFIEFIKFFNAKNVGVFVSFAKPVGAWEGHYEGLIEHEDLAFMRSLEKQYNVYTHLTPGYGLEMGCIAVKGMFSVTQYGDVLPCPYMHISIGNIFEKTLKEIIENGLKIKYFGEHVDTCPIAEDKHFIKKYIEGKVYNKPVPVKSTEVFTEEDTTVVPFYKENK